LPFVLSGKSQEILTSDAFGSHDNCFIKWQINKFTIKVFHCNCRFKLFVYLFARLQKQLNVPKQDKIGMDLRRINAGKQLASLAHFQIQISDFLLFCTIAIISQKPFETISKM